MVLHSAMTVYTISPGERYWSPLARERIFAPGGRMLDTRTMLKGAMPASRRAASKLASFSLCRPTPLVRKTRLGMICHLLLLARI